MLVHEVCNGIFFTPYILASNPILDNIYIGAIPIKYQMPLGMSEKKKT
jgi:hypothetical protein